MFVLKTLIYPLAYSSFHLDTHQGDWYLCGLPHPLPALSKLRDVRNNTEHALRTAVHRLRLDVAEPDAEVGVEALAGQLEHGDVAAAVEVEVVHQGHRGHRAPHRPHPLEERVLLLVRRDDRPVGAVVQHLLIRLLRARRRLR